MVGGERDDGGLAGAAVVEVLGLADLEGGEELPAAGGVLVDLRDQAGQGVVEGVEEGGLGGDAGEARVLLPGPTSVWRIGSLRVVTALTRMTGSEGLAGPS